MSILRDDWWPGCGRGMRRSRSAPGISMVILEDPISAFDVHNPWACELLFLIDKCLASTACRDLSARFD